MSSNQDTVILNPMRITADSQTLQGKFRLAGGNTGNLIFLETVKEQLRYSMEIGVHEPDLESLSRASVVIPSSNFLMHGGNDSFYQNFINFLDKTNCPVTLIGLGAQSSRVFNTPQKLVRNGLNPVKLEFFKKMSERTVTMGVRGEFTAECLDLMGIHNYRVIGCPSFYKYLSGGGGYSDVPNASIDKIQISVTPGSSLRRRVLQFGMKNNCVWVMQSMGEIPKMCQVGNKELISPKWRLRNFPGILDRTSKIVSYAQNKAKLFFDIKEWDQFYKEEGITFAFGTRFHGNMAALRNRIPALWITHDSRTTELTKAMHLPYIEIEKIKKIQAVTELLEYCDYTRTQKNYPRLCKNYVDFLNENGINHRFRCAGNTEGEA